MRGTSLKCFASLPFCVFALRTAASAFHPGEVWRDTAGEPIRAHGGGILVVSNTYYWYGEDRTPGGRGSVACYSSTNLYDWNHEGVALERKAVPQIDDRRTFIERPKVLFNARTGKYVMWMHAEQWGYHFAHAGIATSDRPAGPFTFVRTSRPITNDFDFPDTDPNHQKEQGGTFRDMNLYLDDDGKAYVFYAAENNWTMYVVRLNDGFTGPELPAVEGRTWSRILVKRMREAPAPFKFGGRYYLLTSACTGWKPNAADCAMAQNILGPYESKGNPCRGTDADTTFGTQSTFVLPLSGQPSHFIFMADRWNPSNLPDSRYVWLPITLGTDGSFTLDWKDQWDLGLPKSLIH